MTVSAEFIAGGIADLRMEQGYSVSYLKQIRSALKWCYPTSDAPDHPLVKRVLSGVGHAVLDADEGVRYQEFPDYHLVQDLLRSWSTVPDLEMDLGRLTKKALMLLRVGTGARASDVFKIDLSRPQTMLWEGTQIRLVTIKPKTARQDKPQSWKAIHVLDTRGGCLCPVATLRAYVRRTADFRVDGRGLFCSKFAQAEDGRLSSDRLNSLMRETFEEAGLPKGEYSGHAVRGMAVTAARTAGVTLDELMEHWHWMSKRTIVRHYDRSATTTSLSNRVIPCVEAMHKELATTVLTEPAAVSGQ